MRGKDERPITSKRLYVMSISCFLAGISLLITMVQSKYMPYHLAFIGALNILTSYGVTVMRKWAFYLALFTSLISLVFGSITLAAILRLFNVALDLTSGLMLSAMILYMALFAVLLAYIVFNRGKFL
ncbi:MAG: hypothetical protein N3E47_04680 [Candidatus Bathyarchaeota archaeon]|nr:hypothetical protein [Candidatus Bathyarchaeota archaeon]